MLSSRMASRTTAKVSRESGREIAGKDVRYRLAVSGLHEILQDLRGVVVPDGQQRKERFDTHALVRVFQKPVQPARHDIRDGSLRFAC